MIIENQLYPKSNGEITIRFTEMGIKHILLDLESKSNSHRSRTVEFKKLAREFLYRCDKNR